MTAGTDGEHWTAWCGKGQSNHRIAERPQLSAATSQAEVYCKEKQWQKRPLGIPSTDDKLVQEVVRVMLEAIYEPGFSVHSHEFRPIGAAIRVWTEVKADVHRREMVRRG